MKGIYDELEQKLRLHGSVKREIRMRKLDLEYPEIHEGNPTKVQTSIGNSDPVGQLILKWESDKELIALRRRFDTIEKFLRQLDETPRIILTMRYMSRKKHSWLDISKRVAYSEGHCREIRKESLDKLADMLSWEQGPTESTFLTK